MNAPPPTPELCGSTRLSIAWMAMAASTALPPRLRTLSPACAASGLAAMTKGSSADAVAATGWAAGAAMHDVRPTARTQANSRNRRMVRAYHDEWRSQSFPLRSAAMARQLERFENLVAMFLTRAGEMGDAPFLWAKREGQWRPVSWREAARQVAALAASLKGIGLQPGDRVALVSENRPEWLIADLAIMAAGCVTVPTYTTNTTRDHTHILENSGARAVIVSNQKLATNVAPAVLTSSECHHFIAIDEMRRTQVPEDIHIHCWPELISGEANVEELRREVQGVGRGDLACIIYTSGTGGAPKGVCIHHGGILHNVEGCTDIISSDFGWGDEVFLSFLPASHAYEHTGGQHFPVALGAEIYYAESLEKLAANIEEVQPTIMVVVPRLFELLRARIIKSIEGQGGLAKYMLRRALKIGAEKYNGRLKPWDLPMDGLLSLTFRKKVRAKVGSRQKAWVSGGAPLNPEVGNFFQS